MYSLRLKIDNILKEKVAINGIKGLHEISENTRHALVEEILSMVKIHLSSELKLD